MPNWLYLTGTLAQLQQVWQHYGVAPAEILPAGSMIGHGDYAFVIDQAGHMRQELDFDPGPGTQATKSSFAARADRRRPAAAGAVMSRHARPAAALALAAGSAAWRAAAAPAPAAPGPAAEAPPGGAPFLATSLVTAAGTWAVAVMGGSVATAQQLLAAVRPPGRQHPVEAGHPARDGRQRRPGPGRRRRQSLITGFRPSQYLTYTPLTITRDGGQAWSSTGPLDAALANVPDALAAAPAHREPARPARRRHRRAGRARLHQLDHPGHASGPSPRPRRPPLRAAEPHRRRVQPRRACRCSAARCSHPGTAGIFAGTGGTWQAAGPALPAALARQPITVLRLTSTASSTIALLAAGTGPAASLLAAWSADSGSHWALSPPLRLNGATLTSASFGPGGTAAIVLNGNRGETIASPGAAWRALPALPPGTATLAPGPAGGFDALAVHRTKLTVWQLAPGSAAWAKAQAINVPIQFGSSS